MPRIIKRPNQEFLMFKNILSVLVVVFLLTSASQSFAVTDPTDPIKKKVETDSLNVEKSKSILNNSEEKTEITSTNPEESNVNFWHQNQEIEEDSTSNSALSFNFIYYMIEKFKFQVE